jgi:multidrug efflux pump subunit AcrA (membrane-fusion protein)
MTIPIAKADSAIAVPVSAVFKGEGNKRVVYVRNRTGTEKREVEVGVTNFDHAQIIKGLEAGEEILLVEPKRVAAEKRS